VSAPDKSDLQRSSSSASEPNLEPGSKLRNRYRIDAFLEVRSGASLYRATDEVTNLTVIVKEQGRSGKSRISQGLLKNPWYDEFTILRSISYPTVVKAVDMFEENQRYYLIIEQLEGRDLGFFLTKEKVTVHQSCDWMIQLCQSLSQLHRRKIVHLDLNPRCIVVTHDFQRVRLTGFSRALQLPIMFPLQSNTPGYSAPELEQQGKHTIDERADIYSLGVIWHELVTGCSPLRHRRDEDGLVIFPEVTYYVPDINPQINSIIMKMIDVEPKYRYQNIDEVKRAILGLFHNTPFYASFITDVGMVREANEDSYFVQDWHYVSQTQRQSYGIFIVADGMGGAQAGEYASALATRDVSQVINHRFEQLKDNPGRELNIPEILEEAIKKANRSIYDAAKRNPQYQGMGTTVTAAVVYQGMMYMGHVGDSRAYLIAKQEIEKVTRDHSLVGRLLEIGQITEEEAAVHPQRNLIYRSLGAYPNVEVDLYERPFVPGNCLLLCSDGLVEHVKDPEIHQVVTQAKDQWRSCNQLVNMANIRGGDDNTTIIIVYMDDLR
jgi:serine/threonine protein phosphatase PrpC